MIKAMRVWFFFLLLTSISCTLVAQPAQNNDLKNISIQTSESQINVLIEYTGDISYESFSLVNPNRLVLDFFNITQILTQAVIEINEIGITSVRSALNRPGVARVVFNFTDEVPQYKMERTEKGLMVSFRKDKRAEEKEPEMTEKIVKEPEEIPKKIAEVPRQEKEPEIQPPSRVITKPTAPTSRPAEDLEGGYGKKSSNMALGFSSGYSAFQDSNFKTVYGEGGVFIKGEYSLILPINVKSLDVWTGFTYFQKNGKTSFTEEDLTLRITTFSLSLRYLRRISRFNPFVGAGIDYITYKEILPEDFIVSSVGGSELGFHAQVGTYLDLLSSLALKVHIKYNWAKATAATADEEVNLGGVEYGIGLIFLFNL
jgi:outer membrane protein W